MPCTFSVVVLDACGRLGGLLLWTAAPVVTQVWRLASIADPEDQILTSDPGDLEQIAAALGFEVAVIQV